VPAAAFWIAGAIAAFVSQASVMRFSARRRRSHWRTVSARCPGTILAVCLVHGAAAVLGNLPDGAASSCYGVSSFGPAINALAIVMTAKVLGVQLALRVRSRRDVQHRHRARDGFHLPREEKAKAAAAFALPEPVAGRPLSQTAAFFAVLVASWCSPLGAASQTTGFFAQCSRSSG